MNRPKVDKNFTIKSLKDLPLGTYEKGLLLTETMEGWRTEKPVVDNEACINCQMCYLVCPEGAIYKNDDGKIEIDYRFCKGCGICSKHCNKNCIAMVKEVK